jgi:hypothetical protein
MEDVDIVVEAVQCADAPQTTIQETRYLLEEGRKRMNEFALILLGSIGVTIVLFWLVVGGEGDE